MNDKKRLNRKCADCGDIRPVRRVEDPKVFNIYEKNVTVFVQWVTDPFAEEIDGDMTLRWMCDTCEYNSCMEV